MTRILVTGLSGVGKSSFVQALLQRRVRAVDADDPRWSTWVDVGDDDHTPGTPVEADRDWVWDAERIEDLLAQSADEVLFVAGTSPNMGRFRSRFDCVILLSAPAEVMADRLRSRTNNPYGQHDAEVERALDLIESVEPLLRHTADVEIDTSIPLDDVVARVLRLASEIEDATR